MALNQAAQSQTGWEPAGPGVASADAFYLEGKDVEAAGAYHLNYGAYHSSAAEVAERLAVRAAHANGRPCVATFRPMHEWAGKQPMSMFLQGVTVAQDFGGSAQGDAVWYLFAFLQGRGSDDFRVESASLSAALSSLMCSARVPETQDTDSCMVELLRAPLFHARAAALPEGFVASCVEAPETPKPYTSGFLGIGVATACSFAAAMAVVATTAMLQQRRRHCV